VTSFYSVESKSKLYLPNIIIPMIIEIIDPIRTAPADKSLIAPALEF
jgi:hypothetical protein